jgi:hypothetical protein
VSDIFPIETLRGQLRTMNILRDAARIQRIQREQVMKILVERESFGMTNFRVLEENQK